MSGRIEKIAENTFFRPEDFRTLLGHGVESDAARERIKLRVMSAIREAVRPLWEDKRREISRDRYSIFAPIINEFAFLFEEEKLKESPLICQGCGDRVVIHVCKRPR